MKDRLVYIARHIEQHAQDTLSLASLGALVGWSAGYLQRQFKARFGVSPKEYQNFLRTQHLKQHLKQSPEQNTLDAIYASGYGSPSRIYGTSMRHLGMTPARYGKQGQGEDISYAFAHTPFGLLAMAATDRGVCFVEFGDSEALLVDRLKKDFSQACITQSSQQTSPQLQTWLSALGDYMQSHGPQPNLPLDMRGTAFQVQVWQFLLQLASQQTVSYGDVAKAIGKPKSTRAVANACGQNNIAVLVPCHKVLRSDGSLGGYRWGTERKRALLKWEQQL
jgi:AraC family transcriptional regulator of adaptative response/methylated-DNA-[protein]-cysteine methyltransferase